MNHLSFFNKKNYSSNIFIFTLLIFSLCQTVYAESSLYDKGRAFYYGDGVEQDYGKALLAFEQGAKVGDLDALTALGIMYIVGVGVENN